MAGVGEDHRINFFVVWIIGHHDFGHENTTGRRHKTRREEIVDLDPHRRISRKDRACDARHARCHHKEKLRRRKARQIGADN